MSDAAPERVRVAVVGAGFAGLAMAVALQRMGIDDFVVIDRGDEVGGTWRDNTYPGCQCDVPSHLYSLSYDPNPEWSRTYSPQPEILDYLRRCATRHGVRPRLRLGEEVTGASWDAEAACWDVVTTRTTYRASVLVGAIGALSEPRVPDIPGLSGFRGTTFHSAAWRHDCDLRGRRVGVVGTGASAIQLVPRIQPEVARLAVFQRTPPWILPHTDRPITRGERALYRSFPPAQRLVRLGVYCAREGVFVPGFMHPAIMRLPERAARRHLRRQVADPALRRALTPGYRLGCKRVLLSNEWYPTLTRPNVDVVTAGIDHVEGDAVVTRDGARHALDVLIFATGFWVTDMPMARRLRGRDGLLLADAWAGGAQAYRGTSVPGFPNLFFVVGPNTGLAHSSMVLMIESQVRYITGALRTMDERGVASVEVRGSALRAYNDDVQRRLRGTVWNTGGCSSWYLDRSGRNTAIWPGSTLRFRLETRRFDAAAYRTGSPAAAATGSAASRVPAPL